MTTKSLDTRARAKRLMSAYVDSLVGIFSLRLPGVSQIVRAHAPTMGVKSSYPGEDINLHAADVVDRCSTSGSELFESVNQITAVFVAAMWDLLRSHASYDSISTAPEVQFLKHLRNACSHDGRWNFTTLAHPAVWRDKQLTLQQRGEPAFGSLLNHGDPMLLFMDIDRKYFEQP